jgi:N-acetyl-anhydromuramyl-L-alanine amidase AmpD
VKYLEWLIRTGFRPEHTGVTEDEVAEKARPLENPGSSQMKQISGIVVHHSATETGNAACFRVLHRVVNGWNDVGYHFVIGNGSLSADGEVEYGRVLPFQGAHAKGANEYSVGICLVGNFNRTVPTAAQMDSLGILLRRLAVRYSIDRDFITIHRLVEGSHTQCPGSNLTLKDILYLFDNK